MLLGQLALIETRAQDPHRPLLVLQLRLLVLHRDDDPARFVGGVVLGQRSPRFGQVDEHQVAQLFNRVGGDADSGDAIGDVQPFVVFGEFQHGLDP